MLSGEAIINANFITFGLIWSGIDVLHLERTS